MREKTTCGENNARSQKMGGRREGGAGVEIKRGKISNGITAREKSE